MRLNPVLVASFAFASTASTLGRHESADLEIRALPDAPSGYTPRSVNCPSTRPSIRSAGLGLSSQEQSFLSARRKVTVPAMQDFLGRMNIAGFDVKSYFGSHSGNASDLPNVAIALSGGGYRALLNGAGAIQAFDSREPDSTASGHLGGLLQSATYVAGLSGGSWLVGSIYVNNFTTVGNLLSGYGSTWDLGNSIFDGPKRGPQVLKPADYLTTIYNQVQEKTKLYETTITDYWGRALSFQFVNASKGGPEYTWSSIARQDGFSTGQMPMPLVVADARAPGETILSGNTTVFEFNPYEFGTWDPTTYGWAPLEYVGSNFSNGVIPDNVSCVRGFDNVGYVMGTSSSLFNQFLLNINSTNAPSFFKDTIQSILKTIAGDDDDIASWSPNPFYRYNPTGLSRNSDTQDLTLVDGGSDNQNIPLHPLIQPVRNVDVIIAVDSSADTSYNWPNGSALVTTYQRSVNVTGIANHTSFPAIPDVNTMVNLGLNTRPTFFGCDASNTTGATPLIVYIPQSPYVYFSNVSTFDPIYNDSERNAIVQNGYNVATMGNGTVDAQWPTCLGCAVLSRSWTRTRTKVPDACDQCFKKYCWDGTLNATKPANYSPSSRFATLKVNSAPGPALSTSIVVIAAVVSAMMVVV